MLTATHVSFIGSLTLESDVDTVNADTRTLTLAGLHGVTVQVNQRTALEDGSDGSRLTDIHSGDHLNIRGYLIDVHTVIATAVERRPPTTHVVLRGPVESAGDPTLDILGTSVNTSPLTDDDFTDVSGDGIGRRTFFSAASSGTMVSIQGTLVDGTVNWSDVALEH